MLIFWCLSVNKYFFFKIKIWIPLPVFLWAMFNLCSWVKGGPPCSKTSVCPLLDEAPRQYEGPLHHYRPQQESPSPQQPPPPPSQAEGAGQVPRTHRLITLADHICVSFSLLLLVSGVFVHNHTGHVSHRITIKISRFFYVTLFFGKCSMDLTSSSFSHSQQIITQDFARNQVSSQPPQQPSTSTFQSSPSALVSTPVRTKTSNRYSPESQSQSAHHQRPGSRVSPETLVDKSRARYGLPWPHVGSPAVKQSYSTFTLGDSFLTLR